MQQFAKALKFEIVVAVGAVATVLLMLSAIQFISAKTLATPVRWSRFLRQAVKVDLMTKRMIHHEDTQAVHG